MDNRNAIAGLRIFLYVLLALIRQGTQENIHTVQDKLSIGVASYLYQQYEDIFNHYYFHTDNLEALDEYFRLWNDVSDDNLPKYDCGENDGLYLLIKLALNDIAN